MRRQRSSPRGSRRRGRTHPSRRSDRSSPEVSCCSLRWLEKSSQIRSSMPCAVSSRWIRCSGHRRLRWRIPRKRSVRRAPCRCRSLRYPPSSWALHEFSYIKILVLVPFLVPYLVPSAESDTQAVWRGSARPLRKRWSMLDDASIYTSRIDAGAISL